MTQRAPRAWVRTTSALVVIAAVLEPDGQVELGAGLRRGAEALELGAQAGLAEVDGLALEVDGAVLGHDGDVHPAADRLAALAGLGRPGGAHAPADDGALLDVGDLGGQRALGVLGLPEHLDDVAHLDDDLVDELAHRGPHRDDSFWTTSTRELTEMPRPVSVTSASVCSSGWSTPGTLVIRPLRSVPRAHRPERSDRDPAVGNGSCRA